MQASNTTSFTEAWHSFCKYHHDCRGKATVPNNAYVISVPHEVAKRDFLLRSLEDAGLIPQVIDGVISDQVGDLKDFMECFPANGAYDCQAGITMGHIKAWKALASSGEHAAWIFEDDAVLHDRAAVLFPHYWARVPHDYQMVYIGHIQPDSSLPKEIVHVPPKTLPMGTHAYIIDASTAQRLAKLGEYMMHRSMRDDSDRSSWQIDGDDIKIDHFIKNYYDSLIPHEDRSRWAVFDSPPHLPWSFGNVTVSRTYECECHCEIRACLEEEDSWRAPVKASGGLASQHVCGGNIDSLRDWHKEISRIQALDKTKLCNMTAW